jgi:hypothetical protein
MGLRDSEMERDGSVALDDNRPSSFRHARARASVFLPDGCAEREDQWIAAVVLLLSA